MQFAGSALTSNFEQLACFQNAAKPAVAKAGDLNHRVAKRTSTIFF
jgi:hypothetical protein